MTQTSDSAAQSVPRDVAVQRTASLPEPHAILAAVAAVALLAEYVARETGSSAVMLVAAAIAAIGFVGVWRRQDELRLLPLLGLTLAFQVAWVLLHLRIGLTSFDSVELYRLWGNELLDGRYPEAQYPPGAVLLFAFDAWLGNGATRTSHAFVMVPFQLATVAALWAVRTHTSAWLAALVALWPLNAFFWEFRFDLAPTAFLAVGLLAAYRDRWVLAGALLGVGAAVKWVPAVAFALVLIWLLSSRRGRAAVGGLLSFCAALLLLHVPFLVWSPDEATFAYRYFGDQGLTGESVWYLLLAPFGLASVDQSAFWLPADVPGWADPLAVALQGALLLLLAVAAVRVRGDVRAGLALAALGPVLFLLANRVFSPQYLVTILVAWAMAGALVLEDRRDQLVLGALAMGGTTANAFVYPYTLFQHGLWRAASAALFAVGLGATAWLAWQACREPRRARPR